MRNYRSWGIALVAAALLAGEARPVSAASVVSGDLTVDPGPGSVQWAGDIVIDAGTGSRSVIGSARRTS